MELFDDTLPVFGYPALMERLSADQLNGERLMSASTDTENNDMEVGGENL